MLLVGFLVPQLIANNNMEFPWLDNFCGSPFWDTNRTWNTDDPYFTPCFEQTILTWFPAILIVILSLFELYWRLIYENNNKYAAIPFSALNICKGILTIILVILPLILLYPIIFERGNSINNINNTENDENVNDNNNIEIISYPVELYTPIIKAVTYVIALFLLLLTKSKGVRSSGSLFIFWTVALICECIIFRSTISNTDGDELVSSNITLYVINIITFVCILALFLLNCWADTDPIFIPKFDYVPLQGSETPSPEKTTSFLSQLLFEWFSQMTWKGFRKPLEYSDLWDLNDEDKSNAIVPAFMHNLEQEKIKKAQKLGYGTRESLGDINSKRNGTPFVVKYTKSKIKSTDVSVMPILYKTFGSTFVFGSCLKIIPDLMVFVSPLILQQLIAFVNEPNSELWKGLLFAGIMFSSAIVQTLLTAQYSHRMYISGMRVRTALVNAIYRKALVVSNSTKRGTTLGEIVNLMSVDVQKIMDMAPFINYLWSSPFQVGIAIYFQWGILGPSVLAGLSVMILIIPLNAIIIGKAREYQVMQMKLKDQRVKLMNEILSGIKVLKLYAWEPSFQAQIEAIRNKEVHVLRLAAILSAGMNFLWMCAPFMVSLATFATFVLIDENNVLDATKAFVSLSLFSVINFSVSLLPNTIQMLVLALVSLKRINKFMNCEEVDPDAVSHDLSEGDPVVIENGNFTWDQIGQDDEEIPRPFLKNINFRIRPGSCVAIVGAVGSGKSTILSAIIGETNKLSGRVNTIGSIAYVAQQAWIQNVTLRNNILFGVPFNSSKYDRVIQACALKPDITMLPAGDKTEIGEKGINLSGGQKQRVAIARAVYSNSDVYLLDDPLSAVDSHVGKHIFDKVIGPKGILKNKTRILVTHGIVFLPEVDQIVVLKDGEISEVGTYQELLDAKGAFAEFLEQHANKDDEEDEEGTDDNIDDLEGSTSSTIGRSGTFNRNRRKQMLTSGSEDEKSIKFQRMSVSSIGNKLIEAETPETESVQFSVYLTYFRAAGWNLTIWTLALYTVFQGFSVGANLCLSDWSNLPLVNGTQQIGKRDMYLGLYGAFGVMQGIAIGLASVAMALGILKSATVLHHEMLFRILRCPMYFFDTTPLGRIVNRFSKDVDTLDAMLPLTLRMLLNGLFQVLSTLVVISYTTPLFIAVIIPIGIVYYLVQKFYVSTSRQLKRLESVTRSPIYSHFGESVVGSPTIRTYKQDERFIQETEAKVDFNQKSYYPAVSSNRWLAVRLETVGNLVIFFAALFAVLGRESLSPGLVGLSVTYALQITLALNMVVRWITDLETNLVAVERIKEYMQVPQEASWEIDSKKPQREWPEKGQVEFNGYRTRYREGLDLVLRNVTCTILPGEKVGIVGRTGAGKSSLTLGLFRIVEAAGGSIKIDGIDISKIGLHDVRGRITIIPQDPVLFSGSFRLNLDPFEKHNDDELWRALELAHLKSFVKGLPLRLQHEISEGGENLSVGQRQLVCLARALLRKTKILVLDEATAAIDLETDDLIQATIRSEFKDATVITIAHRLNTIMDSTRVMVLDKGEIHEFDSPANLLNNTGSIFYSMARDAGLCS